MQEKVIWCYCGIMSDITVEFEILFFWTELEIIIEVNFHTVLKRVVLINVLVPHLLWVNFKNIETIILKKNLKNKMTGVGLVRLIRFTD